MDYAQQIKEYDGTVGEEARRYSPATCKVVETKVLMGAPDSDHISTS